MIRLKALAAGAVIGGVLMAAIPASRAADLAAAKKSYDTFCAKCHGTTGKGDGPGAGALSTRPRDFSDCAVMSKISDDTLFNVIKNGGASVGISKEMAPFSEGFEDNEIHDLVAYVRTFCKK